MEKGAIKVQKQRKIVLVLLLLSLTLTAVFVAVLNSKPAPEVSGQIAQDAELVWEKTFGGCGDDRAFAAVNAGNGFLVAGSSTSFNSQNRTDAWALRVDQEGNEVWNRTFTENYGAEFRCILSLDDGFLLAGNTFQPSGNTFAYIVKVDDQGLIVWSQNLTSYDASIKLFSATQTADGFCFAGLLKNPGYANSNVWLAKMDSDGNVEWSKVFEGFGDAAGRAITPTGDAGLIVASYCDLAGNGNYDFLLLKTDLQGNLQWQKTFGGSESDKAYTIVSTRDGYVVAGDTRSKGAGDCDAWIVKVDLAGNLVWDRTVGGAGFDTPTCVAAVGDGGFVFAGTTFSFGNGQRDFWLFKVSENGKVVWSSTVGRSGYEEAYAVVPAGNDKDFILTGWTNSIGAGGRYDFYIVKVRITR